MLSKKQNCLLETTEFNSEIKVFGIGGAGINTLNYLIQKPINGVFYIGMDTNDDGLDLYDGNCKMLLCTQGKERLYNFYEYSPEYVIEIVEKLLEHETKIVFLVAGMGGFTGTMIAPIIAKACKDKGILVVAMVSVAYSSEEEQRIAIARTAITELQINTDKLYIINNDKLKELYIGLNGPEVFKKAYDLSYRCLLHTYNLLYSNVKPTDFKCIEHFFKNGSIESDEEKCIHLSYLIALGSEQFFKQISTI